MKQIIDFDQKTKKRIFQQVIDIFVIPEIERRKKMNKLPSDFRLERIQVIFSSRSGRNYVRLNKEVKAIIKVRTNKPIQKGDIVYEKDIDKIESIDLTKGDTNYGHFTLLYIKDSWIVSFDFIYNKEEIRKHIEASNEFYESAKENLKKKRLRPFFENAFASAELFTKSLLLSLPIKEQSKGSKHQIKKEFLKNWADLGNVKPSFSTTLSKLYSLRSSARYLVSDDYKKENPEEIILTVEEMIKFSKELIKEK